MTIWLQLAIYLLVGFVEMFLATQRTLWLTKGRSAVAAGIVFFENLLAFFILYNFLTNLHSQWTVFLAYSMGGSLGTLVNFEKKIGV